MDTTNASRAAARPFAPIGAPAGHRQCVERHNAYGAAAWQCECGATYASRYELTTHVGYYATIEYKVWLRKRLAEEEMSLDDLADAIKRLDKTANATSASLSQLLGPAREAPVPTNTTLMPLINRVLGIAPPPICNPDSPIAQLLDRLAARWTQMTERERSALVALIGDGEPDAS